MIKKTFVVQSADPLNFNKYLDDKINEFQSQGLSVEIFFSSSPNVDECTYVLLSALIIGRDYRFEVEEDEI